MPIFDEGTWYLTFDDLLAIHDEVAAAAERHGLPLASDAVMNEGALRSAADEPRQTFARVPLYASLYEKAAAIARAIICGHAFVDGNKRTGLDAAVVFLRYNGWVVDLSQDEFVQLALDIAGEKAKGRQPLSVPEIAERLRAASTPIEL